MASRFLLAIVVAVGLAGCGAEHEKEVTEFPNAVISRSPDASFTLKSGDQTISNISSIQFSDQQQDSEEVKALNTILEPVADDSGGGSLCCNSCSLSGGVLICTGCKAC